MDEDISARLHYLFAVIAGAGGVIGVFLNLMVYAKAFEYAERQKLGEILDVKTLKYFFIFKVLCAAIMIVGLIGFCVVGPIFIFFRGFVSYNLANYMSLMEWVFCIPMGLCDGCASLENWFIVEGLNEVNFDEYGVDMLEKQKKKL